jgi:chromosome segregation ATPase
MADSHATQTSASSADVKTAPAANPAKGTAPADGGKTDPKADLQKLQDTANANQDQIDALTKANAAIKLDISALTTGLGEVDQVVNAYTQAYKTISDKTGTQTFVTQQTSMALAAVGSGKDWLDGQVSKVDGDIKAQSDAITAADTGLQAVSDKAATAQAAALKTANDKQAAYDAAKGTLARAQAVVADLAALKTQVTSAADAGSFGTMYILLLEMSSDLNSLNTPDPKDLQTALNQALSDLKDAKADLRDKKDAADAASAALATAQKKVADTKNARRATLLAKVKDWTGGTAQTGATSAAKATVAAKS